VIYSLEEAVSLNWKTSRGKNIVLAHGCFDILHTGHIKHLEDARAFGDCLIVGITADKYVKEKKGSLRPVVSERDRAKILDSLACVSDVVIISDASAVPLIEAMKPRRFVRGEDHLNEKSHAADIERLSCENNGGKVVYTKGRLGSSSHIINRVMQGSNSIVSDKIYKDETAQIRFWLQTISIAPKNTAQVIGEPITDHYIYVTPAGKSTKENTISYLRHEEEMFQGGVNAVKMHLRQSCEVFDEKIVREPVIKTRFLDKPFRSKLFSIANNTDVEQLTPNEMGYILEQANDVDITCIADFGHGLISYESAETLSCLAKKNFLAITVQSNSLNYGFNTLRKWKQASYVVADEEELRLSCEDAKSSLSTLIRREFERLELRVMAVTCGHDGCIVYDGKREVKIPALNVKAIDRMGAGDAFFGWTIPFVLAGAPIEVIGIIGNLAGAVHVSTIGNSRPVFCEDLENMLSKIVSAGGHLMWDTKGLV
jgi:rfaE bifunctional protein nucleotidyltransferase chain/domain